MPHNKATPDAERPTIDTLIRQGALAGIQPIKTIEVTGKWSDGLADFSVTLTGDKTDVDETLQALINNGNLEQLLIYNK